MATILQALDQIESRFSLESAVKWLEDYRWLVFVVCAVYLLLLYSGRRWMRDRPAYKLRFQLATWNAGLAAFSVLGALHLFPALFESVKKGGIRHSVCYWPISVSSSFALWVFLFLLSKLVELGDTAFIILRKTPLTFLHWYHHVTVLLYSWISLPTRVAVGHWFGAMNCFVHSIMYSYYFIKSSGYKVPSWVAQCITILQLLQFALGLYFNLLAFWVKSSGEECMLMDHIFYYGMILYGSYALLFLNFFYHRYIKKP